MTANGPDADLNNLSSSEEVATLIAERESLAETMLTDNELDYLIPSGQTEVEMLASLTGTSFALPSTSGSVLLEDGRIAIPQVRVIANDSYVFNDEWIPHLPYFVVSVHILAQDPETDEWLLDEVTWLCGGDCDQMITDWREREAALLEQSGVVPATPEATPAN